MARKLITSVAVALSVGLSMGDVVALAERQSPEELKKIRVSLEELVGRRSEDAAARLKGFARGVLSNDAAKTFARWDATNVRWKRERAAGAAPHLAEGVMWDCLSRMGGVVTPPMRSAVEWDKFYEDKERARPGLAVKAFDRALKQDSTLVEAQFRRARIRAATDAGAVKDLERFAGSDADSTIAYLSAISRAETAVSQNQPATAVQWYERALALRPRSTAATIALSLLTSTRDIELGQLDASDPYYRYPCRILTADVDREFTKRMLSAQ